LRKLKIEILSGSLELRTSLRLGPLRFLEVLSIQCYQKNLFHCIYIEHENSVDAIDANPKNDNEFATGSHDKTIKVWDVKAEKSIYTIAAHTMGVWCINYNT
jgi:WD40 repeat protein